MQIALVLSTAFVTTESGFPERERRITQYVNGFRQVTELTTVHPCFDVFSVDNTVKDPTRLERRVTDALDRIPGLKGKYHFWNNEMGRINKGSGLVVQWEAILPDLVSRYEYTVHYEPRQDLVSWSFFEQMESHPDTYICPYRDRVKLYGIPLIFGRYWTGLFSMKTSTLLDYVRAPDRGVLTTIDQYRKWWFYRRLRWRLLPGWLAEMPECIESDFPRYVRRHQIPFVRVTNLGTRWHEEATGKWISMVDRLFQ